jgi:hypothetical protein
MSQNTKKSRENKAQVTLQHRNTSESVECTEVHRNAAQSSQRATAGATKGPEGIRSDLSNEPLVGELREIVDAWDSLPESMRAGIVAMVRAVRSS